MRRSVHKVGMIRCIVVCAWRVMEKEKKERKKSLTRGHVKDIGSIEGI